jgi:hypothetical protein
LDESITYVCLDMRKDTIAVALAEAGERNDVCAYGKNREHSDALELWRRSCRAL